MCRNEQSNARACYNSGEQNKDITKSREARDWKDTQTLLNHLQEQNPFFQTCEKFAL